MWSRFGDQSPLVVPAFCDVVGIGMGCCQLGQVDGGVSVEQTPSSTASTISGLHPGSATASAPALATNPSAALHMIALRNANPGGKGNTKSQKCYGAVPATTFPPWVTTT
jgi:hypothetical protein